MSIAFVQSKSAQSSGATSITTPSFTSTSGNFLVAGGAAAAADLGGATPITDSKSNTWQTGWTSNLLESAICRYAENITGGASHTVTLTPSASVACALAVGEFSGLPTSSTLDQTAATRTSANPKSSGATATTAQANELLIGIGNSGPLTPASTQPFVDVVRLQDSSPNGVILSYMIASAIDTFQYSFNYGSGSQGEVAGVATFKGSSIAFVQAKSVQSSGATSVTTPSMTSTAGNFIGTTANTFSRALSGSPVSDNKGNTYPTAWVTNALSGTGHAGCWYAENIAGGASHTVTFTPTGGSDACALAIGEFSGINTSSSKDQTASAASTATTWLSGRTAATAQANELILGGGSQSHGTNLPNSGGFAPASNIFTDAVVLPGGTGNSGMIFSYAIVSAAAAYAYVFEDLDTNFAVSGIATFKGVAVAGSAFPALTVAM